MWRAKTSGARVRDGFWSRLGGLSLAYAVFFLAQIGLVAMVARGHGVTAVGLYGLAMAVGTPAFAVSNLGLRNGLATDMARAHGWSSYVRLRSVTSLVTLAGLGLGSWALASGPLLLILSSVAAMKAAETFSDLAYGAFERAEAVSRVSRSLVLRGVGGCAAFALAEVAGLGLLAAISLVGLVWAVVAFGVDLPVARRLAGEHAAAHEGDAVRARTDAGALALARSCAPLGWTGAASAIQNGMPRYVVGWLLGVEALGLFTVVVQAYQAGLYFANALAQGISGRLASRIADGRAQDALRLVAALSGAMAGIALIAAGAAYLLGEPLLALAFGAPFATAAPLLAAMLLALAPAGVAALAQMILTAQRRFRTVGLLQAGLLVLSGPVSLIGASAGGLMGVVAAIGVMATVRVTATAILLRRTGERRARSSTDSSASLEA